MLGRPVQFFQDFAIEDDGNKIHEEKKQIKTLDYMIFQNKW